MQRLHFLSTAGALCLVVGVALAADNEFVLRAYDVSFLTMPMPNYPGLDLFLVPFLTDEGDWEVENQFMSPDEIVSLIKWNVEEEILNNPEFAVGYEDGMLTVVAPPSVHEMVSQYIAAFRSKFGRMINVQFFCILLRDEFEVTAPVLMRREEFESFLKSVEESPHATVVSERSVVCFNGQRVHTACGKKSYYLSDYDVEVASNAAAADPVMIELFKGTVMDVEPAITENDSISLVVRYSSILDDRGMEQFETNAPGVGMIQEPDIEFLRLRTVVVVGDGGAVCVGAVSRDEGRLLLYLRPRILKMDVPEVEFPPFDGKRQLRIFDIRGLSAFYPDFPPPDITDITGTYSEDFGIHHAGVDMPEGVRIEPATIVDLIRNNVARDSWLNKSNRISCTARTVVVIQTPDVLDEIERYLGEFRSLRGRLVSVEVHFVELTPKGFESLLKMMPGLRAGEVYLSEEQMKHILTEARKGEHIKLMGYGLVTGLAQQRFHIALLDQKAYVHDYDIEIADSSVIADPIVEVLQTGLVIGVQPQLVGDERNVVIDIEPTVARPTDLAIVESGARLLGRSQSPLVEVNSLRTCVSIRDGSWCLLGITSGRDAREAGRIFAIVGARVSGEIVKD